MYNQTMRKNYLDLFHIKLIVLSLLVSLIPVLVLRACNTDTGVNSMNIFIPTVTTAQIYYVSPTGNDANPGTISLPWQTPFKAGTTALAGDTVIFRGGTYYSQLAPKNSGNPTNGWITFQAYPGEEPIIIHDAYYSKGVQIDGVNYIKIIGLTAIAAGENGPGISINNAHHIHILDCVVRDSATSGIATTNGVDYITIEGNTIHNNSNIGQYNGSGISIWNSGGPIYDNASGYHIIIKNNLIYNNRNLTTEPSDGNGIILDNNDQGGTVEVQLPKTLVANNVIFDNGGRCIHVRNSSNADLINNSCYHNLETEKIAEGCNGEITLQRTNTYSSSVNIQVYNNIVYGKGGTCNQGRNQAFLFQVFCNSIYCPQYKSGYNLWYNGAVAQLGSNDLTSNPFFINLSLDPKLANFNLATTSPAIDSGTDLFETILTRDYIGNVRPQGDGFDRGAYEHVENLNFNLFIPFLSVR